MIYLLIIGLPVFLAFLSDHSKGALSCVLFSAALFVPCYFAGVRDITVGTDVAVYGVSTFHSASVLPLRTFLSVSSEYAAVGFNFVTWVAARAGSFPFYLGMLQALAIIPMCGYAKWKYSNCSWVAMAIYMTIFFPNSLNTMKQMIAVAICVPAFEFIDKKPLIFVSIVIAASLLFHQTAIVALFYYPAVVSIRSIGDSRAFFGRAQALAVGVAMAAIFAVAFVFGNAIVSSFSFLKESYSYQANASGTRLNYSALVLLAGLISVYFVAAFFNKAKWLNGCESRTFGILSIVGAFAIQLNMVADSLMRFAFYPLSFLVLFGPSLVFKEIKDSSAVAILILLILCSAYFVQAFVINGGGQIYPYTSALLGVR